MDDKFHSDPKRLGCSLTALGLWVVAGSWSADHLTDGRVPMKVLRMHGSRPKIVRELIESGLWIDEKPNGFDGISFKNWSEYQPIKSEVEARAERLRNAGRAGGKRSAASRKRKDDEAEGKHDASQSLRQSSNDTASPSVAPPTRPVIDTSYEVSKKTPSTAAPQRASEPESVILEPVDEDGHRYPATTLDLGIVEPATTIEPTEIFDPTDDEPPADEPPGFAEWYAHYPRKVGRKAAASAYAKARKSVSAAKLLVAVRRFAADPNLPTTKKYIAHPSTWLNEGRWDDEPLPADAPARPAASRPQSRNDQNRDYMARRLAAIRGEGAAQNTNDPYRKQIGA